MDKSQKIQRIADGLNTASKIKETYNSSLQRSSKEGTKPPPASLLAEILKIIAESSPSQYRNGLTSTVQRSTQLSNTYRDLKIRVRNARTSKPNLSTIVGIIDSLKPAMDPKNSRYAEKIVKIHQILKS